MSAPTDISTPRDLCDKCIHFTTNYKFHHTTTPIPLNGRLAHRLSYTNENRFFFKLPWEHMTYGPACPVSRHRFWRGVRFAG